MNRTLAFILSVALFVFLTTVAPAQITPLPPSQSPPAAPITDPKAMALLAKVEAKLLSIKTLSTDFTYIFCPYHGREQRVYYQIRLMKPNYAFFDEWTGQKAVGGTWDVKARHASTSLCDGKTLWSISTDGSHYIVQKTPNFHWGNASMGEAEQFSGFYSPAGSLGELIKEMIKDPRYAGTLISVKYTGVRIWQGSPYRIVECKYVPNNNLDAETLKQLPGGELVDTKDIYIGNDNIIRRITIQDFFWLEDSSLENMTIDTPMTKASFAYKPLPRATMPQTTE